MKRTVKQSCQITDQKLFLKCWLASATVFFLMCHIKEDIMFAIYFKIID